MSSEIEGGYKSIPRGVNRGPKSNLCEFCVAMNFCQLRTSLVRIKQYKEGDKKDENLRAMIANEGWKNCRQPLNPDELKEIQG